MDIIYPENNDFIVGFSGGSDSVFLVDSMYRAGYNFIAVHVNHGSNENSDNWEEFCRSFCASRNIPFKAHKISISKDKNFEYDASKKRYDIFLSYNKPIVLAHHFDDKVETFFKTLFKGAGPKGLTSWSYHTKIGNGISLYRPLIQLTKQEIKNYCCENNFDWVEDPTNSDNIITRNWIRNVIIPNICERIPWFYCSINNTMQAMEDVSYIERDMAHIDWFNCKLNDDEYILDLNKVKELPYYRIRNLLHYICYEFNVSFRERNIENFIMAIKNSSSYTKKMFETDKSLKIYQEDKKLVIYKY